MSHKCLIAIVFLVLSLTSPCMEMVAGAGRPRTDTENSLTARLNAIEAFVRTKLHEHHVPGVALVIVKDDRVIYSKGLGVRDRENDLPVTPRTLFPILSTTKAFTAMTVIMSADDGKLALTDSPKNYLRYFKLYDPEADRGITISHLLSHRSGIDSTDLAWYAGRDRISRKELIRIVALAKPKAKLGETFMYQNTMFVAAAEVVAKAQGMPWKDFLSRRILKPLGMRHTILSPCEQQLGQDHALGYTYDDQDKKLVVRVPMRDVPLPACIAAAGGIYSDAEDMEEWLHLLVGGGVFEGKRMVSETGFAQMIRSQITVAPGIDYGYGWVLREWKGHKVVEHGGAAPGFSSRVAFMPDQKLGFAFMANINPNMFGDSLMETIWEQLVPELKEADSVAGDKAGPTPAAETADAQAPAAPFKAPISVEELMQRAIEARSGEANLRKHTTAVIRAELDLEQQGMTAETQLIRKAPNMMAEEIRLFALGRKVGTYRYYFDGNQGGTESSFISPQTMAGQKLANAQVLADFHQELNWHKLFKTVTITGRSKVGDEEVYVVEKKPEKGDAVTDYISTKTFLLLKRETPDRGTETFRDYRAIDGVLMPFAGERNDWRLGILVGPARVTVRKIYFDVQIPDSSFQPSGLGLTRDYGRCWYDKSVVAAPSGHVADGRGRRTWRPMSKSAAPSFPSYGRNATALPGDLPVIEASVLPARCGPFDD
jgi:CubicO group peptidase (beta-lactamase class C family)